MRAGAPLDLEKCHDGSGQSSGVPPSWMGSESSEGCTVEMIQAPATVAAVPFVNDGTFMQQFAQANSDSYVSTNIETDNLTVAPDVVKATADSKPKKSLLAAFSTKKKEAKPAAVSTGPETEEQVKKRKRDEYLMEMAKYRNSACGDGGGKHSLVK